VFFESPRRTAATLSELAAGFGPDRAAAVCRELTKTYEEVRRGTLAELADWAAAGEVLGEVTIVVAGSPEDDAPVDPESLRAEVIRLQGTGMSRRDAVDVVAGSRGISRRVVYDVANRPGP
jgi:16S rRNA (cytidine1402-2'-O)-methyltransferase